MRLIKTAAILVFAVMGCVTLKAQTFQATYSYDANGNRVGATVIYLSQSPSPSSKYVEDIDSKNNLQLTIYPNPTQGDLRVDITGATPELLNSPNNAIKIWDIQGRLLFSISPIGASNRVDLSGYSDGTFIMQLFFNSKVNDYKIVKN